jgi:LDH2 family malate/lactate/ureidoglycolate dehydrogenase
MGPTGVGLLTMAIDVERFMPLQQFRTVLRPYLASIRNSKKAKGVSRIFLPGEIELEKEKKSLTEGVELGSAIVSSLNQLLERAKSPLRLREE